MLITLILVLNENQDQTSTSYLPDEVLLKTYSCCLCCIIFMIFMDQRLHLFSRPNFHNSMLFYYYVHVDQNITYLILGIFFKDLECGCPGPVTEAPIYRVNGSWWKCRASVYQCTELPFLETGIGEVWMFVSCLETRGTLSTRCGAFPPLLSPTPYYPNVLPPEQFIILFWKLVTQMIKLRFTFNFVRYSKTDF